MEKKEIQNLNLLDLKPKRNARWITTDEGSAVVLVPKFRNPFLVRWVMPYLAKPDFRIKLDDVGTMIWNMCDGATSVSAIADSLRQKFGASVEPADDRINHFLNQLERGDLIIIEQT